MTRQETIRKILQIIQKDDLLIVSTGYVCRDVYGMKDRPGNFYMIGSMGSAYSIGIGIALTCKRIVRVISGDGAALMNLGSLALGKYLHPTNLFHYIVDNGAYASTGGQPTCSSAIEFTQFHQTQHFKVSMDEPPMPRIPLTPAQIVVRFTNEMKRKSV